MGARAVIVTRPQVLPKSPAEAPEEQARRSSRLYPGVRKSSLRNGGDVGTGGSASRYGMDQPASQPPQGTWHIAAEVIMSALPSVMPSRTRKIAMCSIERKLTVQP